MASVGCLVDRTHYCVEHKGRMACCWYMGGIFIFDNYHTETDVNVLYRIGNESEYFAMMDQARICQAVIDKTVNKD